MERPWVHTTQTSRTEKSPSGAHSDRTSNDSQFSQTLFFGRILLGRPKFVELGNFSLDCRRPVLGVGP